MLLAATLSARAQIPSANNAEFVTKATVFEIEEGKLAVQRATDPRLKGFAQSMIGDHTDALKKLASAAGKPIGNEETLGKPHQAMLDNL